VTTERVTLTPGCPTIEN